MPNNYLQRLLRPALRALKPYSVQNAVGKIKLDAMENPYALPTELQQAWLDDLSQVALNRYPSADAPRLRVQLRQLLGVPDGMDVMLGNGSDELIQLLCMAVIQAPLAAKNTAPVVLAPEPGFVMYRLLADLLGLRYLGVPLQAADFGLNTHAMLDAIHAHQPALVFLAYPNNPTGNLFAEDAVTAIIQQAPGLVILDEAYHPYANSSFISQLNNYDNLLVMRTLSKFGLAGIRLGVLAGASAWLQELNKLRLPYNINALSQATAEFACRHAAVFQQQAEQICRDRQRLFMAMQAVPGIDVLPSHANFLLFKTPAGQADAVFQGLLAQDILIKNLSHAHPLLADSLRVTVGTAEENAAFLAALHGVLA